MTNLGPLYRAMLRIAPKSSEEGKGKAIGYSNLAHAAALLDMWMPASCAPFC
jgi:hypothetical protein